MNWLVALAMAFGLLLVLFVYVASDVWCWLRGKLACVIVGFVPCQAGGPNQFSCIKLVALLVNL